MGNNQRDQAQKFATMALQFVMGSTSRDELREYRNHGRSDSNVQASGHYDSSQPPLAIENVPRDSSAGQITPRCHASITEGVDIGSTQVA